jgi:hypothetical protein
MKRFVIIECSDTMSTMFVAVHEGKSVCMTPLLVDSLSDQCAASVQAVPVDNVIECPITKEDLLKVLDKYVFHGDWSGDRDWNGKRVHEAKA